MTIPSAPACFRCRDRGMLAGCSWCGKLMAVIDGPDDADRIRAEYVLTRDMVKHALALLDAAWDPEAMEYDTQGVNQAHRVLRGGEPPRATRQHDVDEGAP